MGFFETVLTKTVENFYGSSVTAISSLKIAELLGYTTIAASKTSGCKVRDKFIDNLWLVIPAFFIIFPIKLIFLSYQFPI